MAVSQTAMWNALQECQVVTRWGKDNLHIKANGRSAQLRRPANAAEEFKIGEARHLVAQLQLDLAKVKKHIPEL